MAGSRVSLTMARSGHAVVLYVACLVAGLLQAPIAQAQTLPAPATPPLQGISCDRLIGQVLVKVPEIVSSNGVLKGTIRLADQQVVMAFRVPPGFGNVPGKPGSRQVCQPQYVRYFTGLNAVPAIAPPPP